MFVERIKIKHDIPEHQPIKIEIWKEELKTLHKYLDDATKIHIEDYDYFANQNDTHNMWILISQHMTIGFQNFFESNGISIADKKLAIFGSMKVREVPAMQAHK
eukprot:11641210-Karenia_brevis.AAC.1